MPQDIVSGLFGLSPMQVRQQQDAAIESAANQYAQQDPFARASSSLYRAGAGLGRIGAGMLGMVNPQVQQAQQTQQVMMQGDADLSTSDGLLAKANQFRQIDPRIAMQLTLKANEMKKQEMAAAHLMAKDDLAERRFQEAEKVKIANEAQAKADALAARVQMEKDKLESGNYNKEQQRILEARIAAGQHQVGLLVAEARMAGIAAKAAGAEKPMTEAQKTKFDLEKSNAINKAKSIDSQLAELTSQANLVKGHSSADTATGTGAEFFPSVLPGSIDYKAQLDNLKGRLTKIAKDAISESGKIGSMQVQEWKILLDTISSITPNANKRAVNDAIANVVDETNRLRDLHYDQLNQKYGSTAPIDKPAIVVPTKRSQYISGSVQQPSAAPATTQPTQAQATATMPAKIEHWVRGVDGKLKRAP